MKIIKTMRLRYPTRDSITKEPLIPGDLVRVTFAAYFRGYDDDGRKMFQNKYELVRRNMKDRTPAQKHLAETKYAGHTFCRFK